MALIFSTIQSQRKKASTEAYILHLHLHETPGHICNLSVKSWLAFKSHSHYSVPECEKTELFFKRIHFIKVDEKFLEVKKKDETIYIEKITEGWLTLCDQVGFFLTHYSVSTLTRQFVQKCLRSSCLSISSSGHQGLPIGGQLSGQTWTQSAVFLSQELQPFTTGLASHRSHEGLKNFTLTTSVLVQL